MIGDDVEFLGGFALAVLTLVDVFSSIIVPGPSSSRLRVAGRMRHLTLLTWRGLSRLRGRRRRVPNAFAPALFFLAFVAWLILLLLAFGLMFHAASNQFTPALDEFGQAVYVAGSSLLTLGVSEVDAHAYARWLLLWAAFSGFAVITATVTFILQIQNSLHQRESGVMTLQGLAGKPISGVGVLEEFAALGLRDELDRFFKDWRDWSTAVLHSHVSYPVLVYFHSVDPESDWLAALHVVLDAATWLMALADHPEICGAATLAHRSGSRTSAHLCALFDLETEPPEVLDDSKVAELARRLERAGYKIRELDEQTVARLRDLRSDYAERIASLGRHLGADSVPIIPDRPR